jgi:hypothetical protein
MAFGASGGRDRGALPAPLVLVVLSFFVLMAFETGQAIHDHGALAGVIEAQDQTMLQAAKVRQQLQTLAGKTAALADSGDAGAKSVIAEMKQQGVTLSAPKK